MMSYLLHPVSIDLNKFEKDTPTDESLTRQILFSHIQKVGFLITRLKDTFWIA